MARTWTSFALLTAAAVALTGCSLPGKDTVAPATSGAAVASKLAPRTPTKVCDTAALRGPASAPTGAVTITPGTDLAAAVQTAPAGTTFWLAPGTHVLPDGEFSQVLPKDKDRFVGAPGAVLDGRHVNSYAFGGDASGVLISTLTIENFGAPGGTKDEGVVNHDAAPRWTVRSSTVQHNAGAGVFLGDHARLLTSCLRENGQYGFSSYRPDGVRGLAVQGNEVVGNNTDDWEKRVEGCGCTGGGKFWDTTDAVVTNNWVHDNHGVGLWADTNNAGFQFSRNVISANDAEGLFYEISYNAVIVDNTFLRNGLVKGPTNPGFPTGAVYVSESGGDQRVRSTYAGKLEIARNYFGDNWSGVVGWENADRFAGSDANTSSGYTTRVDPAATLAACADPTRGTRAPLYDDCRWRTQNLSVHGNRFVFSRAKVGAGCTPDAGCGYSGLFANYGSYPDWSPYQGDVVQKAVVGTQKNRWYDNAYVGPWGFVAGDPGTRVDLAGWQAAPYRQDVGSSLRR